MDYNKELEILFDNYIKSNEYVKANVDYYEYSNLVLKLKEVEYLNNIHKMLKDEN